MVRIYAFPENKKSDWLTRKPSTLEISAGMELILNDLSIADNRQLLIMPEACSLFTDSKQQGSLGNAVTLNWPDLSQNHPGMMISEKKAWRPL